MGKAKRGTCVVILLVVTCTVASCSGKVEGELPSVRSNDGVVAAGVGGAGIGSAGAAGASIGGVGGALAAGQGAGGEPIAGDPIGGAPIEPEPIDETPKVCGDTSGAALSFDGVDDYVTMGLAAPLGLPTFTIETWFKRTGPGRSGTSGVYGFDGLPLVTKGRGESDGDQRDCNYYLGIRSSDGVLAADFEDTEIGGNHPVFGTTRLQQGVWYHGAASFDGSSWRLYLNGRLEAMSATTATPRSDTLQHFAIGSGVDSMGIADGFFAGLMDEVRVWDHARTEAEIQAGMVGPIDDGPGLVGRWGLEERTGNEVDESKSRYPGTIVGGDWSMPGSPFELSESPQPSAVAPAQDSTVPRDVKLSAQVTDGDSPEHDVTFYVRKVTEAPDFTIATLPDTQYYARDYPETYLVQTEWLMANRARLNIVYVAHMGDMVDNAIREQQWLNADAAMKILEVPQPDLPYGLPYCPTVGNHDQAPMNNPGGTDEFNAWFGADRFQGRDYYGGHYGSNNDNNYGFFSASGMDFIHVSLEFDENPDADVIAWADQLIEAHADRRAIVTTHYMINTGYPASFSTQGRAIYEGLKDNPNLFLLLGGHMHGEGRREDEHDGRTIRSILQDYQGRTNGGDGWLRYYVFSPARNEVDAYTYSPTLDAFETDDDSQFSFTYTMSSTEAQDFEPVAVLRGVKVGDLATADLSGLDPSSTYEWYASANDCLGTSVTPTQSFRTAP